MRDVVHLCLAASDTLLNMCKSETMLFSFLGSFLCKMADHLDFDQNKLRDRMIKQLLNLVIAKFPDVSVVSRWIEWQLAFNNY